MHPFEKQLTSLVNTLQLAHDEAGALPPEMGAVTVRCKNSILLLQNFINGLAGLTMTTHAEADSGPVTMILGQAVEYRKPVVPQDIAPTNQERNAFLDDRDNMYALFGTLTNDQINGKVNKPGGEAVVRAVAKKAGYADYKDAKINAKFIEAVKKLIKAESDNAKAIEESEKAIS